MGHTANAWLQVTLQIPSSVKTGISEGRFWSFKDGLMIKTSIFMFSSVLELLSYYSQAEHEALQTFLSYVL